MIYAPNGTMKTSFTKTFQKISMGENPIDQLDGKEGSYSVKINDQDINKNDILIVNSYEDKFNSNDVSKLLVNDNLKSNYEKLMEDIKEYYEVFLKKIILKFGSSKLSLEKEFLSFFGENLNITEILNIFNSQQEMTIYSHELKFKYVDLFNAKTLTILKKPIFKKNIEEYIEIYDSLLRKSPLFEKGKINHNNFDEIYKNLERHNFFSISNKIILANGIEIGALKELEDVLDYEKNKIIEDESLKSKFKEIEALLSNQESKKLREILEENRGFIIDLENLEKFQRKIWMTYISYSSKELEDLNNIYLKNQEEIKIIIKKASEEKTDWEKVIELYNQRFKMPFKIRVKNKANSLLGIQEPQIEFEYNGHFILVEKLKKDILSTGEKRALYLLEVLYKIEVLKSEGKKKIIILDDIADSFDYKNKYAIIEYLNDLIQKNDLFKLIILTHNFDFYRTIASRLDLKKNSFMAVKTIEEIRLEKGGYFENVFKFWREKVFTDDKTTIIVIPFVRNLIEYSLGEKGESYDFLTNLLHYKKDKTENTTIFELKKVYKNDWFKSPIELKNDTRKVIDVILKEADKILEEKEESINLDNKIILSIACRYLAERYMVNKIYEIKSEYLKSTTRKLFLEYKNNNPSSKYINILEEVNLMTAENIHINSFMYEPLIDMSSNHLKELYTKVKEIE
ncbi:MAG: AAA family ATPase [Cetobacterium sp.]